MKEPARIPHVVTEWRRNERETLRVRLDEYQGTTVFDFRSWYPHAGSDELKPGRSGITLSVKHLPAAAAALMQALKDARDMGLIIEDASGGSA